MNRKLFLQRAALAGLAATGITKVKAAKRNDDKVSFESKEKIYWEGAYCKFSLFEISLGEFNF